MGLDLHLHPRRVLVHHRHHDDLRVWRYGAKYEFRKNYWRCMLPFWSIGHSPSRPCYCVEFLTHLSPKPKSGQKKSSKESTTCTHSNCKGHFRGGLCVEEKGCGGQNGGQGCRYAN